MGITIGRTFATREKAELAVEHLVQEHGFERTDIFISADGNENSAGDTESAATADKGPIRVSIDIDDETRSELVETVFDELDNEGPSRMSLNRFMVSRQTEKSDASLRL